MIGTPNYQLIDAYLQGMVDAKLRGQQMDPTKLGDFTFDPNVLRNDLRNVLDEYLAGRAFGEEDDSGNPFQGVLPSEQPAPQQPQPEEEPPQQPPEPPAQQCCCPQQEQADEEEDIIEEPVRPKEPLWLSLLKTILITLTLVALLYCLFFVCFIRRPKKEEPITEDGDMNLPDGPAEGNMNLPVDSTDDKK